MRIAYVARCDAAVESGVLKKMVGQVRHWKKAGHEAGLFLLSRQETVWPGASDAVEAVVTEQGWITRHTGMSKLCEAVERWRPSAIYLRFETHYGALPKIMRAIPTVVELNTNDVTEYRNHLPLIQYAYHRLFRGSLLREAKGFIAVTGEIADRFTEWGKPVEVIANGIDLEEFRQLPPASGGARKIVFVGAPGAVWHGVDEIIALARAEPTLEFHVIGRDREPGWPANVIAHGTLGRSEYESVVAGCDVAIGTLAMYRNGMHEGSTLKVREYLAMGLPCIIGYRDTDFPQAVPFVLELPNAAGNAVAAREQIVAFCDRWRGRRVERGEVDHLGNRHKERARLSFIARLVEK